MSGTVLFAWIGITDLKVARGELGDSLGPIGQAVKHRPFAEIHLLSDHESKEETLYRKWLATQTKAQIKVRRGLSFAQAAWFDYRGETVVSPERASCLEQNTGLPSNWKSETNPLLSWTCAAFQFSHFWARRYNLSIRVVFACV
jgi:hypothetical protein